MEVINKFPKKRSCKDWDNLAKEVSYLLTKASKDKKENKSVDKNI